MRGLLFPTCFGLGCGSWSRSFGLAFMWAFSVIFHGQEASFIWKLKPGLLASQDSSRHTLVNVLRKHSLWPRVEVILGRASLSIARAAICKVTFTMIGLYFFEAAFELLERSNLYHLQRDSPNTSHISRPYISYQHQYSLFLFNPASQNSKKKKKKH